MIKEIDGLISCFLLPLGVSLCELLIELIPGTFCFIITRKKKKLSIKQEMNEIKSSNYNYFEDKDLLSFLIGYKIHITQF